MASPKEMTTLTSTAKSVSGIHPVIRHQDMVETRLYSRLDDDLVGIGHRNCWNEYELDLYQCHWHRWWTFDDQQRCEAKAESVYRQCVRDQI